MPGTGPPRCWLSAQAAHHTGKTLTNHTYCSDVAMYARHVSAPSEPESYGPYHSLTTRYSCDPAVRIIPGAKFGSDSADLWLQTFDRTVWLHPPPWISPPSANLPCTTVYLASLMGRIFRGRYLHSCSWNSVSVPKNSALETSPHELSEDSIVRYVTLVAPSCLSSNRAWQTAPGAV